MRFYLSIILIITYINSSNLKKKQQHFNECLLKRRICLDDDKETGDILQNDQQKKLKLSVGHITDFSKIKCKKKCLIHSDSKRKFNTDLYIRKKVIENKKLDDAKSTIDISSTSADLEKNKYVMPQQIKILKRNIVHYMTKVLTVTQQQHYLPKLENIYLAYHFIMSNEDEYKDFCSIFEPFDHLLIEKLDYIIAGCNQDVKFVKKDFELFNKKLNSSLSSEEELSYLLKLLNLTNLNDKKILFYGELKNLVKYFAKVPELMVLGGFFSDKSIDVFILSMHLINLLLEKRKTDINNKVFVLFLIKRAFMSSIRNRIDLFSIKMFLTDCLNNKYSLHFFLWEMNNSGRAEFKLKLAYDSVLHWTNACKIHFKTILLMFLFQQIIFLKLNNAGNEEFKRFINLIYCVIIDDRCPDCDFNEFVKLLEIV